MGSEHSGPKEDTHHSQPHAPEGGGSGRGCRGGPSRVPLPCTWHMVQGTRILSAVFVTGCQCVPICLVKICDGVVGLGQWSPFSF